LIDAAKQAKNENTATIWLSVKFGEKEEDSLLFQAAISIASKYNWCCWGLGLPNAQWHLLLLYHPL
jgi:hypothetical protein